MNAVIRDWRVRVALAIACVAIILLIIDRSRRNDPEYAARAFLACVIDQDASCVRGFMTSREAAYGPTQDQLERYFNKIYGPRMEGFRPAGEPTIARGTDRQVLVVAEQKLVHRDGRTITVAAPAYITESGTAIWPTFGHVLVPLFQQFRSSDEEPQSAVWLKGISSLKAELESIGIKGVFLNTGIDGEYLTWSQWESKLSRKR